MTVGDHAASRRDRQQEAQLPFGASRVAVSFKLAREQTGPSHNASVDFCTDSRNQVVGRYAEHCLQSERSPKVWPPSEPLIARYQCAVIGAQEKSQLRLREPATAPERAQIGFHPGGHSARAGAAAAEGTGAVLRISGRWNRRQNLPGRQVFKGDLRVRRGWKSSLP